MDEVLEEKFLKFVDVVISNSITDMHIGSSAYPYVRTATRDIKPIEQFGILTYDEVISLIIFMNPLLNQDKIEHVGTGISFIYEYK